MTPRDTLLAHALHSLAPQRSAACGAALCTALVATLAGIASAQPADAQDADRVAREIAAALEAEQECRFALHGEPRFADLSARWLVGYSAEGEGCDDAAAELQRRGEPAQIAFFRRPTLAQVNALIARMRSSIEHEFGCRILVRGEPRFDQTSTQWSVAYGLSGESCGDAGAELARRGAELAIFFYETRRRQELVR